MASIWEVESLHLRTRRVQNDKTWVIWEQKGATSSRVRGHDHGPHCTEKGGRNQRQPRLVVPTAMGYGRPPSWSRSWPPIFPFYSFFFLILPHPHQLRPQPLMPLSLLLLSLPLSPPKPLHPSSIFTQILRIHHFYHHFLSFPASKFQNLFSFNPISYLLYLNLHIHHHKNTQLKCFSAICPLKTTITLLFYHQFLLFSHFITPFCLFKFHLH